MPLEPNAVTVALLVVAGLFMAILGRAVGRAIAEMRWRRRPGGAQTAPPVVTVVVRDAAPSPPSASATSGVPPGAPAPPAPWSDPGARGARPTVATSRLADVPAPVAYRPLSSASGPLARNARQRPRDAEPPLAREAIPGFAMPAAPPGSAARERSTDRRRRALLVPLGAMLTVGVIGAVGVLAFRPASPQVGVLGASASPRATDTAASTPGEPLGTAPGLEGSPPHPLPTGAVDGGTAINPGGRPGGGDTAGETGGGPDPGTPGPGETTPPLEASPPAGGDPTPSSDPTAPPPTAPPTAPPDPAPTPTPTPTPSPAPTDTPAPTPVAPDVTFSWTATGLTVKFTNGTSGPHGWSWEFGDGSASTIRNPSHTYADAGTYLVRLTATTSSGAAATYAASVTVP